MMKQAIQFAAGTLCLLLLAVMPALGQSQVRPRPLVVTSCGTPPYTYTAGNSEWQLQDVNGNSCVAGSFSSSISGFPTTQTTGTPIAVTNVGVTGTLPAGTVVVASNVGATNTAYCKLGASATTSDQAIPANSWFAFTVGSATQLTCITSSSTTTVNMVGGSGLPAGSNAGSGGSGSNASVSSTGAAVPASGTYVGMNVAGNLTGVTGTANGLKVDGSAVTQPVSAASLPLPTGASTAALQPTNSAIGATTSGQTGTLHMGAVTTAAPTYTTAQSDPLSLTTAGGLRSDLASVGGTTVLTGTGAQGAGAQRVTVATDSATVAGSASIPAGTNLMGKVGIDQTTPGTTNGVALAQVGSATVLAGNGASGTGSQRVNVANDNTAIANWGQGATGSAVPTGSEYFGLIAKTALPAAGTDGNLVGAMADKFGRQITRGAPRELLVTVGTSTAGTSGTLLAAQGAGVFADLYRATLSNSSATTVAVTLSDGTNSYTYVMAAGATVQVISGTVDGATPAATANTAWTYTVSSAVSSIFFAAQFVLNK